MLWRQQLLLSASAAFQKRAWLYRRCRAAPTMIAVEPKGVEDGCFAHQTGQQTWKVNLFTWFLSHSVTRITHPAARDFVGLYTCHTIVKMFNRWWSRSTSMLTATRLVCAASVRIIPRELDAGALHFRFRLAVGRVVAISATVYSKRVGCRCNAFPI